MCRFTRFLRFNVTAPRIYVVLSLIRVLLVGTSVILLFVKLKSIPEYLDRKSTKSENNSIKTLRKQNTKDYSSKILTAEHLKVRSFLIKL